MTAVETVAVADEPAVTLPEVGDTATEKSFVAVVQVGSAAWAGTETASQAALTVLKLVQLAGVEVLGRVQRRGPVRWYVMLAVFDSIAL